MKTSILLLSFIIQSFLFSEENSIERNNSINQIKNKNGTQNPTELTITEVKMNQFIEEAFLNAPQYKTPEHIQIYKEYLSRVIFISGLSENEIPNLSTIQKKNKYNLNYSYNFSSIENFNPLMYTFNFETKVTLFYKIDNQNYTIKILPKI